MGMMDMCGTRNLKMAGDGAKRRHLRKSEIDDAYIKRGRKKGEQGKSNTD